MTVTKFFECGKGQLFLATAGDDSNIMIAPLNHQCKDVTVEGHVSAIKDLSFCHTPKGTLLFSVGGVGSLKCWRLDLIDRPDDSKELQVASLASCPMLSENVDDRVMAVTSWSIGDGLFIVVIGSSDGFIRVLGFHQKLKWFTQLGKSNYHGKCLLTVDHKTILIGNEIHHVVFTGATDGKIAVWDMSNLARSFLEQDHAIKKIQLEESTFGQLLTWFQAHQSGVNCLDVSVSAESKFTIVSGGDDNGIFLAEFFIDEALRLNSVRVFKFASAHGSSLKGAKLLGNNLFATVSTDQRLNFWEWQGERGTLVLQKSYLTEVWDVSAMDIHMESPRKITVSVVGNEYLLLQSE